jgi:hypothetical protein
VAAGVSAAIGAAAFGISADIAAAARPKVNNAVLIRIPDLFMRSPNGGCIHPAERIRFDPAVSAQMKIISQTPTNLS